MTRPSVGGGTVHLMASLQAPRRQALPAAARSAEPVTCPDATRRPAVRSHSTNGPSSDHLETRHATGLRARRRRSPGLATHEGHPLS